MWGGDVHAGVLEALEGFDDVVDLTLEELRAAYSKGMSTRQVGTRGDREWERRIRVDA